MFVSGKMLRDYCMNSDNRIVPPLQPSDFVKSLTNDVLGVFSSMVGMHDLLPLPLEMGFLTHFRSNITSMVGLAGSCSGLICLHAPLELAKDFASGMLRRELALDYDECIIYDAMGELANVIAGAVKNYLSITGTDIRLSLPSIFTGNKYTISTGSNETENLTLGFATTENCFLVCATFN